MEDLNEKTYKIYLSDKLSCISLCAGRGWLMLEATLLLQSSWNDIIPIVTLELKLCYNPLVHKLYKEILWWTCYSSQFYICKVIFWQIKCFQFLKCINGRVCVIERRVVLYLSCLIYPNIISATIRWKYVYQWVLSSSVIQRILSMMSITLLPSLLFLPILKS